MTQVSINVRQVTRIEGHGNIILDATDGKIEELKWEVTESPRLFEAMLRGRHYEDVPYIASRICGICSIAHTTASIQATEAAFGFQPSEQTQLLRKLLYDAELLESHVLRAYFLAAPDFLGVGSVFPLVETHGEVVLRALRLKRLGYNLAELLAGRKTHPLSCVVGGFAKLPEASELKAIRVRLVEALADFDATVALFKTLSIPDFVRETEYVALKDPKEYAFISGQIASSDAGLAPLDDYHSVTNEFCVPHSTAKYTKNKRDSYMVGALSRFNLNHDQLSPRAQKAAEELGLRAPCYNPFMITVAQVVEAVHAAEDSINLIDEIVARGLKTEANAVKVRAGRGVGAVEAPRGTLFHHFETDPNGIITKANLIVATQNNSARIAMSVEKAAKSLIHKGEVSDGLLNMVEMAFRAYDPCLGCATHTLPGHLPLSVKIHNSQRQVIRELVQG